MIIVVLIVGVILIWTIFFVGDLIVNIKKSIRRKRQKELEEKNRKPLKGYELCSPHFQAYMRGEIEAGRSKPKIKEQEPIEEYDPTCYGERGGRYYERISKNGRRYRQYF